MATVAVRDKNSREVAEFVNRYSKLRAAVEDSNDAMKSKGTE